MKGQFIKDHKGLLATAATAVLIYALWIEMYFIHIRKFAIGNTIGKQKLKLVLLSDLHFKRVFWSYYKNLAKKVNALEADLILIAGDTVDVTGRVSTAEKFFKLLNYDTPKVAILGNHEHKSKINIDELNAVYKSSNCDLLINESKVYHLNGNRIMITGLDDFIEGKESFLKAVENVGWERNHLLLIHSPLQQEKTIMEIDHLNERRPPHKKINIQYIFAGHNHGGQIKFLGYAPVLPQKSGNYVNGWYNYKSPFLYVSKGFGTTALPLRFGARSEVTIFEYGV